MEKKLIDLYKEWMEETREIKFRAWDQDSKTMIAEGFHLLGEVTAFGLLEMKLGEIPSGKPTLERVLSLEIMQFTGLKDKNGVDIYEGDILAAWIVTTAEDWEHEENLRVVFKLGSFCTVNDKRSILLSKICDPQHLNKFFQCEIIGNIYQTPEKF